ncbi:hypothetical protein [Compostibacter hankyongensis]|uniref:Uncharacterized protein n=1 Tax=Compostibacter hankyongensis TaxID=1007089 RepID=A0ABP8FYS1_9BACT
MFFTFGTIVVVLLVIIFVWLGTKVLKARKSRRTNRGDPVGPENTTPGGPENTATTGPENTI